MLENECDEKIKRGREAIKLVLQKMIDPKTDWDDTVFVSEDIFSATLFDHLASVYESMGGKDLCPCGGGGCPDCNYTGFVKEDACQAQH